MKELADVVATPVERLLQQMREAGLPHTSAEQVVTDNEKQTLLNHLKGDGSKAEGPRKITLQRKTTQTLKVSGSKTISVEVRKKKTYVKRSPAEIEPSSSASWRPSAPPRRPPRARRLRKPAVRRKKKRLARHAWKRKRGRFSGGRTDSGSCQPRLPWPLPRRAKNARRKSRAASSVPAMRRAS